MGEFKVLVSDNQHKVYFQKHRATNSKLQDAIILQLNGKLQDAVYLCFTSRVLLMGVLATCILKTLRPEPCDNKALARSVNNS